MTLALIDYGMGNLRSVERAVHAVGGDLKRVEQGRELAGCDAILLPGVGNFGDGMRALSERGFIEPLKEKIESGTPFLGICLGMQMLFESSEEAPGVAGLGIFKGRVIRFDSSAKEKVPQIGWNSVHRLHHPPLQPAFPDNTFFYFVHTYHVEPVDPTLIAAECTYIRPFAAAVGRDNIYATQFHPEKSQDAGLDLLRNFLNFRELL